MRRKESSNRGSDRDREIEGEEMSGGEENWAIGVIFFWSAVM